MKFPRRLVLFNVFVVAFNVSASAIGLCGPRDAFIKRLAEKYHESNKAMAFAGEANILEVFVSEKGTWTMIITTPEGQTCIFAAGQGWKDMNGKPIIPGKDT